MDYSYVQSTAQHENACTFCFFRDEIAGQRTQDLMFAVRLKCPQEGVLGRDFGRFLEG